MQVNNILKQNPAVPFLHVLPVIITSGIYIKVLKSVLQINNELSLLKLSSLGSQLSRVCNILAVYLRRWPQSALSLKGNLLCGA